MFFIFLIFHIVLPSLTTFSVGFESLLNIGYVELAGLEQLFSVSIDERGSVNSLSKLTEAFMNYENTICIANSITEINIQNNHQSDISELKICGFQSLVSINIGDNCFEDTIIFSVQQLPLLKSIELGSYSFLNAKQVVLEGFNFECSLPRPAVA